MGVIILRCWYVIHTLSGVSVSSKDFANILRHLETDVFFIVKIMIYNCKILLYLKKYSKIL